MNLLEVKGLVKDFKGRTGILHRAVDDVSFTLEAGKTLALVGESGAGKSTTGRLILRLIEPDAGTVVFDGVDVRALDRKRLTAQRRYMQMIFQDPFGCLDPRISVGESIAEPLFVHFKTPRDERMERAAELLERVGLGSSHMARYPAQLSGGQLQRISIARALTLEPKLIVCDEPVAALDMSIRAQVLNLLTDLQEDLGLAYLFVTHDMSLVQVIADDVAVMRSGRLVENRPVEELFADPQEDYTRQLLAAIPRAEAGRRRRHVR
ncbi:ATP-binding cassette domain-containing protein [Nocardioides massiliensis]|uniref:Peptide/nickel transport system ATP-binding protein/oligopeptide transport system ATP-binding protein n=1 Tax=Nocardioides massiliensis TaxID=1325935 RepID=A0ABT9NLS7_9ACTN|nr:ATP-binding cassette domain-containing protein [Nocardioides massiliensis]MDP9820775.1 peptide/nickel transport system ATP-binding protein/oligopeptide transport system ATP-binding protein [Nocardioides massiliensis]